MTRPPYAVLLLVLLLLAATPPASGAPDEPRPRPRLDEDEQPAEEPAEGVEADAETEVEPEGGLSDLEDYLVLEEDRAPPPPLVRVEAGALTFLEARTELTSFKHGVRGSELRDLEEQQGLDEEFVAPWVELSIGSKIRYGGDAFFFIRGGDAVRQTEPLVFDGETVAAAGEFARPRFSLLSLGTFVTWDALYGRTYRMGLEGGARYFRLDASFETFSATGSHTHRARGELVSPYFGGYFHLTPFPYLTVSTRVRFMNWSWAWVGLREARYFDFRLGAQVNVVPGVLAVALRYRFLTIQAAARDEGDPGLEAAVAASGFAFSVVFTY